MQQNVGLFPVQSNIGGPILCSVRYSSSRKSDRVSTYGHLMLSLDKHCNALLWDETWTNLLYPFCQWFSRDIPITIYHAMHWWTMRNHVMQLCTSCHAAMLFLCHLDWARPKRLSEYEYFWLQVSLHIFASILHIKFRSPSDWIKTVSLGIGDICTELLLVPEAEAGEAVVQLAESPRGQTL